MILSFAMAGQIAIDKVDLVSIFVECILYGTFSMYQVPMGEKLNPALLPYRTFHFPLRSLRVRASGEARKQERAHQQAHVDSIYRDVHSRDSGKLRASSIAVTRLRPT